MFILNSLAVFFFIGKTFNWKANWFFLSLLRRISRIRTGELIFSKIGHKFGLIRLFSNWPVKMGCRETQSPCLYFLLSMSSLCAFKMGNVNVQRKKKHPECALELNWKFSRRKIDDDDNDDYNVDVMLLDEWGLFFISPDSRWRR